MFKKIALKKYKYNLNNKKKKFKNDKNYFSE